MSKRRTSKRDGVILQQWWPRVEPSGLRWVACKGRSTYWLLFREGENDPVGGVTALTRSGKGLAVWHSTQREKHGWGNIITSGTLRDCARALVRAVRETVPHTRQDPARRRWMIFSDGGDHLATVEAVTAYEAWREAHLGGKFYEYTYREGHVHS